MNRGVPHGFEVQICFIVLFFLVVVGCSRDLREEVLPFFFLGCGAAEPLREMRRAEARVIAGCKALIIQLCAEIAGVDICGHLPRISSCAQEMPDEFIHPNRFGTGNLDRAVQRFGDGNVSQGGGEIIRRDRLHETWR